MIHRSTDIDAIFEILNHPRVYGWVSDDCSQKPHNPVMNDSLIYLMDESKMGVVMLVPVNGICCSAHIALRPEMWGGGVDFVKESIRWGVTNTRYMKLVCSIPEYNRLAIRLVKKCGLTQEGRTKKSFLKNMKLYDQLIFGITKREFLEGEIICQQQQE